jgi:hypothetical protein
VRGVLLYTYAGSSCKYGKLHFWSVTFLCPVCFDHWPPWFPIHPKQFIWKCSLCTLLSTYMKCGSSCQFHVYCHIHSTEHPRYSAFGKSLCTYKKCWKWCPRASIQAWTRLILFANIFCRSACEMFLMYTVIAVFNSLSVCGRSRYRSLSAQQACVGDHDTIA